MTIPNSLAAAHDSRPPRPPRLLPGDPGYAALVARGNRRFSGRPQVIRPVTTTAEMVAAVQDAVDAGHRLAIRSGGHNLEDFVDHPDVHTVIDASAMDGIGYDEDRRAFVVGPGATLGGLYRALSDGWGVALPAGLYPGVGVGGHIPGGGYGYLSRLHGLAVDHLEAVEVVVVDADGRARAVLAGREGPHRDLWWAHTGGGGGTFGAVTRFWLCTPGTSGEPSERQLPPAPPEVLHFHVSWSWDEIEESSFVRLVDNHGLWAARESAAGSPSTALHSEFSLWRRPLGTLTLEGVLSARHGDRREDLEAAFRHHLDEIGSGTGLTPTVTERWMPWTEVFEPGEEPAWGQFRMKVKDAYARTPLTPEQIRTAYRHLIREDLGAPGAALSIHTYGGAINTVGSTVTAVAQRDSLLKLVFIAAWEADGTGEEDHLRFLRELYRDLFAESGGVPVPGDRTAGSYLNHADLDLADPVWNASGVTGQELLHGENLARLRQVKTDWDPRDVFHHALSVRQQ